MLTDLFERDEEDVIEKSDEEPEKAPSPVTKPPPGKSKIRKAIDKTYIDEDGFVGNNCSIICKKCLTYALPKNNICNVLLCLEVN